MENLRKKLHVKKVCLVKELKKEKKEIKKRN